MTTSGQPRRGLLRGAVGTPPHVLHLLGNRVTAYASKGILTPFGALMQKDKDVKAADFAPKMWEIFSVKGKQYAIAREGGPNALYYN